MANELVVPDVAGAHLVAALQVQLVALAQRPITVRSLIDLQKTAGLARKLLELQDPKQKLLNRVGASGTGYNANTEFDSEFDDPINYVGGAPLAPALGVETFGASVIRELIPAIKQQGKGRSQPHLAELLEAYEIADKRGLKDLAQRIEARIERTLTKLDEDDEEEDPKVMFCEHEGCAKQAETSHRNKSLCLEHYDAQSVEAASEGAAS